MGRGADTGTWRPKSGSAPAVAAIAAVAIALAGAAPASAFQIGFDEEQVQYEPPSRIGWWIDAGKATRASIYRFMINWRVTAPTQPSNPSNPADPAYDWRKADAGARYAAAIGAELEFSTFCAPKWAQGPSPPALANGDYCYQVGAMQTGGWKPDASAFGEFGKAIAKRYDGTTPDPLDSSKVLPRVRLFEAWNEPNYKMYLQPQCSKGVIVSGSKCTSGGTIVSTTSYRNLLNAFYAGVKSVRPDAIVSAAGMAPSTGSSQGAEIGAQPFLQGLMCLKKSGARLIADSCPTKATLDAISFHPYTFLGTPTSGLGKGVAAGLGESPELRALIDAAARIGTVLPNGRKELWATEFGWITNPPGRPTSGNRSPGIPPEQAGDYTAETIYRLWSWGVDRATWFRLADVYDTWSPYYFPGGLYFYPNGIFNPDAMTGKPSLAAFRFPMFAFKSGSKAKAWALAPCRAAGASVRFEALSRGTWRQVARTSPNSDGTTLTSAWSIPSSTTSVRAVSEGPGCTTETSRPSKIAAK